VVELLALLELLAALPLVVFMVALKAESVEVKLGIMQLNTSSKRIKMLA
jgi:hypothetical protein